jgi:hypothetical protein
VFTSRTTEDQIFYCVHHVLPILYIYFSGARFNCRAYTRGLDYLGRIRRSSPGLSHHLADGLYHQPTSRSVRRSLTLSPTSWLDCSLFALSPTSWLDCSVFALLPTSWLDCSVLADQSFRPVGWIARRSPTSWLDYSVRVDRSFRPVG